MMTVLTGLAEFEREVIRAQSSDNRRASASQFHPAFVLDTARPAAATKQGDKPRPIAPLA
jgi:hypothetical protein